MAETANTFPQCRDPPAGRESNAVAFSDWINPRHWLSAGRSTRANRDDFQDAFTTEEKIKVGPTGMILPKFLPYVDETTGETSEQRKYYRLMLADGRVKASILGKLLAVAALDLRIIPKDKKNERDRLVAKFVDYCLRERLADSIPGLVWSIGLAALVDGYSISEKCWAVEDKGEWPYKWVLRELKTKKVDDDVVLETDEFNNVKGVRALRYNSDELYNPKSFVIYRHMSLYGSPVGMSDLRAAYSIWWMLDAVQKLRAIALEKRAIPPLIGTYSVASHRNDLSRALERLKSSSWATIPESALITALDIAGRSEDLFANAMRDLREDLFLSIQLATLQALTAGAGVLRGSSDVHRDTANLGKWFLQASIQSCLNNRENGLVPDLVDRNFVDAPYPKAVFGGIDDRELLESIQVDSLLHQMLDLSQEGLYERTGREPPKSEEDKIPSIWSQQQQAMQQQPQMDDQLYQQQLAGLGQKLNGMGQPAQAQFSEKLERHVDDIRKRRGTRAADTVLEAAARLLSFNEKPVVKRVIHRDADGVAQYTTEEVMS